MENDDNTLDIQQNVGNVEGDFSKSITIDMDGDDTGEMGDVEAVIDLTYNIFQYIPELVFVSIYALCMYAAVLYITKRIKG
ncbi:uncharacterized protein METZ01_LOCUS256908 [marine metagenome]|uniref:Uncharacterized protein n=1 Tax=marine metagenome TaxID=408172 RepID=A0A382IW15_9ZZZZ